MNIILTPGTLPDPACYSTEQERFEAYVAQILADLSGDIQWQASNSAPDDLELYWLELDATDRPKRPRKYSTSDARWAPFRDIPFFCENVGGTPDVITVTNTPDLTSGIAFASGRKFLFTASGKNSGAVTLNIDGLGAKPVRKFGNVELESGDILEDQIVEVVYNSLLSQFEISSPTPPSEAAKPTYKSLTSGVPSNNATVTMPHDQTKKPEFARFMMRCVTADAGFDVGDEVEITSFIFKEQDNTWPAFLCWCDTDNVYVHRPSQVSFVYIMLPSASNGTVTTSSWELVVNLMFMPDAWLP